MTDSHDELLRVADDLEQLTARAQEDNIREPLDSLKKAAEQVGKAWSGSWFGYHANVYYQNFQSPPPGAHFNMAWGLKVPLADLGSTGDWVQYPVEDVKATIYQQANCVSLEHVYTFSDEANTEFRNQQQTLLSIIEVEMGDSISPFLTDLKEKTGELKIITENQFLQRLMPNYNNFVLYDEVAGQGGMWVPPHLAVLSEVYAIQHTINIVASLAEITRQVKSHVSRRQRLQQSPFVGTRVFIGHGHSQVWRELKDFLEDNLGLSVDEFNRVPTAGIATTSRLSMMLDTAGIALLVMTGEDEQADGEFRPRENVVHEAGMFQGRLGFERAIILLEEGCEKFSNNAGLGHINFPKNNIRAAFQDVREVLEREGFMQPEGRP